MTLIGKVVALAAGVVVAGFAGAVGGFYLSARVQGDQAAAEALRQRSRDRQRRVESVRAARLQRHRVADWRI